MNQPSLRHLLPLLLLPVLWGCLSPVGAELAQGVGPAENSRQSPSVGAPGVDIREPPRVGAREPLRLEPPPVLADEYRDFCRNRPGGCAENYQRHQAPFREERAQQSLDRLREHELRLQHRPDLRR